MKKLVIHLISESSGQTVKHAASTAMSQFSDVEFKQYLWPMTRNVQLLEEVFKKIEQKPGIIIYTLSNNLLRKKVKQFAFEQKLPAISVVGEIIKKISEYIGVGVDNFLGYASKFDEQYFHKVDAIDYSLRHDDGQQTAELEEADIILVGPSRTSKTPTSVYLAYNGFKTANVPYVYGIGFPDELFELKNPSIFGLTVAPSRLVEIRQSRMNILQVEENLNYTDISLVSKECNEVKRICHQHKWPVIDVSRRSIEEAAALIMKYYYEQKVRKG